MNTYDIFLSIFIITSDTKVALPPGNDHLRNPRPRVYPQIASLKKKRQKKKNKMSTVFTVERIYFRNRLSYTNNIGLFEVHHPSR